MKGAREGGREVLTLFINQNRKDGSEEGYARQEWVTGNEKLVSSREGIGDEMYEGRWIMKGCEGKRTWSIERVYNLEKNRNREGCAGQEWTAGDEWKAYEWRGRKRVWEVDDVEVKWSKIKGDKTVDSNHIWVVNSKRSPPHSLVLFFTLTPSSGQKDKGRSSARTLHSPLTRLDGATQETSGLKRPAKNDTEHQSSVRSSVYFLECI